MAARDLPLLTDEIVRLETQNPAATGRGLQLACAQFKKRLQQGGQLMHHVTFLPRPVAHCTVCFRNVGGLDWLRSGLVLEQARGALLNRISGIVFNRLAGQRPPFCCSSSWHSLDALEMYARYGSQVEEAPINPGTDPSYSSVGASLRLLPTAPLDTITHAWQVKYGVGSRSYHEMHAALQDLVGERITSSSSPCHLGDVRATVEVRSFSRAYQSHDNSDIVVLFGQLTLDFSPADGSGRVSLALPSAHTVLAVVNFCQKGRVPVVQGSPAYLKRRHGVRPNSLHVMRIPVGYECRLACRGDVRREVLFIAQRVSRTVEAPSTLLPPLDLKVAGATDLLFLIRVPSEAPAGDADLPQASEPALNSRRGAARKSVSLVPVVAWLLWLAGKYSRDPSLEAVTADLRVALAADLAQTLSRAVPEAFVRDFVDLQLSALEKRTEAAYRPFGGKAKSSSFFCHVEDTWETKLAQTCRAMARTIAVHLGCLPPDAQHETKSMVSCAEEYRTAVRAAVSLAVYSALQKALGLSKKQRRDEGARPPQLPIRFGAEFLPSGSCGDAVGLVGQRRRCGSAVVDAYGKHYGVAAPALRGCDSRASFCFLMDRALALDPCCPMCRVDKTAVELVQTDALGAFRPCRICSYVASDSAEAADLVALRLVREELREPLPLDDAELRRQRLALGLLVAMHLTVDRAAYSFLCGLLKGRPDKKARRANMQLPEGSLMPEDLVDTARGKMSKRSKKAAALVHDSMLDGRLGKDNNPDLRIFLLSGSVVQRPPRRTELMRLLAALKMRLEPWSSTDPDGASFEVRCQEFLRFKPHDLHEVLVHARRAVHEVAYELRAPDLAMCSPFLKYDGVRPVVTLLCSGHELLRPVKWRSFSAAERLVLSAPGALLASDLHQSWDDVHEKGLSFDALIYAGVVAFVPANPHFILKDAVDFERGVRDDGLTFGLISPELESHPRALQTYDAVCWPGGHPVRTGSSATMGCHAHTSAALSHRTGALYSMDSVGHDPCKVNVRNLVATAPDNHYGSTLKLVALLNEWRSWLQEDSFPESADAFRHTTFRHHSDEFRRPLRWSQSMGTVREALQRHLLDRRVPADFAVCMDEETGLPSRPYVWVKRGQAVCFVPGNGLVEDFLFRAPRDMWVREVKVREESPSNFVYTVCGLTLSPFVPGQKMGQQYQKFVNCLLEDWLAGGRGRVTGLLSSTSIASRTAVQNITRSWMTSIALAAGVDSLALTTWVSDATDFFVSSMQRSSQLSASSLTELRLQTPGVSVSNRGPLVAGRFGRHIGDGVQLMMSVLVATQDAGRPNGSVAGVAEASGRGEGQINFDPIVTALVRSLGLEQRECTASACTKCGMIIVKSGCQCPRSSPRPCNINKGLESARPHLACLHLDVRVKWTSEEYEAVPIPSESPRWATTPSRRDDIAMSDVSEKTHRSHAVLCERLTLKQQSIGLCFGSSPSAQTLSALFIFAMQKQGPSCRLKFPMP